VPTLEETYNRQRAIALSCADELDEQVGPGQRRWYTQAFDERPEDRRVAENLIWALDNNLTMFDDLSEVRVLDLACGLPYVWEHLRNEYGIKKFTGIDLMEQDIFDSFLEGIDVEYTYYKQDVFVMLGGMIN